MHFMYMHFMYMTLPVLLPAQRDLPEVTFALTSFDGQRTYASRVLTNIGEGWVRYTRTLTCSTTDMAAKLELR